MTRLGLPALLAWCFGRIVNIIPNLNPVRLRRPRANKKMDRSFTLKRLCIAFALVCLICLPLLAQTTNSRYSGSWQVVRADYGWGNNWVDVTDRVRSLVRGDSLNFRVNGLVLRAQARRAGNRSLRLQLRDNDGRTRQITYRDNQQVSLRVNGGDDRGLHINRAVYASRNRSLDVTSLLNSQVQGEQLNIVVNDRSMGGDPDPRQAKTLAVDYSLDGRSQQTVVRENDTLRLPYDATSQNNLQITRAIYGSGYHTSDVTSRLNSQMRGDELNLQIDNNTMGGDPAPGQAKTLTVEYTLNGRNERSIVREGDMLRLPGGTTTQSTLRIDRATYGADYQTLDVTSRLNSRIQGDQLNLQVNRNTMGGDPAPGRAKSLTVQYSVNGRSSQVVVNDGDSLHLPYATTTDLPLRVRCESVQSNSYGRKYCPADTRGGVRLIRQISNSTCSQGSSWGYDTHGVWVDNGCQAEFEMSGNSRTTGDLTTIPSGTELSVRTNEPIDSKASTAGQQFSAVIAEDVRDGAGLVTIPRGSDAELVIRGSNSSDSNLVLDVDSITVSGTRYQVSTDDMERQGGEGVGANKKTAIYVGGGAALGTVIGAIVGGGKGAAIGAAVGAGAGLGTEVLTKGSQVRVPTETLLRFRLDQDLRLRPVRSGYRGSPGSPANN